MNCRHYHHPKCINLKSNEAKMYTNKTDSLWACLKCSDVPLVKSMLVLAQKYEQLLAMVEHMANTKISTVGFSIADCATQASPVSTHASAVRNRGDTVSVTTPIPRRINHSPIATGGLHPPNHKVSSPIGLTTLKTPNNLQNKPKSSEEDGAFDSWATVASKKTRSVTNTTPTPGRATKRRSTAPQASFPSVSCNTPTGILTGTYSAQGGIGKQQTNLSVVCSNIPESTSTSLKGRQLDDLNQWRSLSYLLGVTVEPAKVARITRHPNSKHYGEPRLLRVVLNSITEVESVMLSVGRLRDGQCTIRIFPEATWSDRYRGNRSYEEHQRETLGRTILLHGVPAVDSCIEQEHEIHDKEQWFYIRETLSLNDVLAVSVSRLRRSPNYKGNGPRVLKVVLQSQQMADRLLKTWNNLRDRLPSELRLKAACNVHSVTNVDTSKPNTTSTSLKPDTISGSNEFLELDSEAADKTPYLVRMRKQPPMAHPKND